MSRRTCDVRRALAFLELPADDPFVSRGAAHVEHIALERQRIDYLRCHVARST